MDEVDRHKQNLTPPDPDAWNHQMYRVRVFDQLVYDNDPNLTNVLIGANSSPLNLAESATRTSRKVRDPGAQNP
jgi:hypothetical protein